MTHGESLWKGTRLMSEEAKILCETCYCKIYISVTILKAHQSTIRTKSSQHFYKTKYIKKLN